MFRDVHTILSNYYVHVVRIPDVWTRPGPAASLGKPRLLLKTDLDVTVSRYFKLDSDTD